MTHSYASSGDHLRSALGERGAHELETAAMELNRCCDFFAQALLGEDGWSGSEEGRWEFGLRLEKALGRLERAGVPVR